MISVIVKSDERNKQRDDTLREYGINPNTASSYQKDMADCVAMETNRAYIEASRR